MRHKTFQLIEAKADESGTFTALASVFDNVDSVGDRVLRGAFSKTLERWRESGDPIPVILSHNWQDPYAMIGKADPQDVVETERGLLVNGKLDIDHNETARQVHRLMRDRLLKGWSFGYTVPDGGQKRAKDATEINEIDLIEVGPTLVGANPEAQLQAVKSTLSDPSPADAVAQLKALAVEAGGGMGDQLEQIADSLETSPQTIAPPTRGDRGPSGEESAPPAKPDGKSPPLKTRVRRMRLDAELRR